MERRTLLKAFSAAVAVPVLRTWDSLTDSVPEGVDRYRKLLPATPSCDLVGPVLAQVSRVDLRASSYAAELAGQLAFDLGESRAGFFLYNTAIHYATRCSDSVLHAWILGNMGFWTGETGDGQRAVELACRAEQVLPPGSPEGMKAEVAALKASAYSRIGDAGNAMGALKYAERCIKYVGNEPVYPLIYPFDESRLASYWGSIALRLGQATEAREELEYALGRLNGLNGMVDKRRGRNLTQLAYSYLLDGEVEEACRTTAGAFTIGRQMGSTTIVRRVQDLRARLDPYGNLTAVRELQDLIDRDRPGV